MSSVFFQEKIGWHHQLPPRVTPTLVTPLYLCLTLQWRRSAAKTGAQNLQLVQRSTAVFIKFCIRLLFCVVVVTAWWRRTQNCIHLTKLQDKCSFSIGVNNHCRVTDPNYCRGPRAPVLWGGAHGRLQAWARGHLPPGNVVRCFVH